MPLSSPVHQPLLEFDHCPACNYELGAAEQARCPECGRVPSEVMAWNMLRRDRRDSLARLAAAWGLLAVVLGIAGAVAYSKVERHLRNQQTTMHWTTTIPYTPPSPAEQARLLRQLDERSDEWIVRPTPVPGG